MRFPLTHRWTSLVTLALTLVAGRGLAQEGPTPASILESGALKAHYNSELLDYLLEEGRAVLPEAQRTAAVDQLVTALKADVEVTPDEQATAAMTTAAAGLAQLLGGDDASDLGAAAGGATAEVYSSWIDSAFILQRAGYAEEANRFFAYCLETFPYPSLRGRCAVGLAGGKPEEAFSILTGQLAQGSIEVKNAILPILGKMAATEGLPQEQKDAIFAILVDHTKGIKTASHSEAAVVGLTLSGDPRAVGELKRFTSGMMYPETQRAAMRGLLLTFNDRSVVPAVEKRLKGGTFSMNSPEDRMFAGRLLIEAGEPSGFEWARQELTKKRKKGLGKMFSSSKKEPDMRPAIVTSLARSGSDQARDVLRQAIGSVEPGSWLETWMAIGLLELGDASKADLARAALGNDDWAFTAVRITTALAKHGDYSGVPVLARLAEKAARGAVSSPGKEFAAFLAGTASEHQSEHNRLIRLQRQIASGLARVDRPECVPVVAGMLSSGEPAVRTSAAYALGRMTDEAALDGLRAAVDVDYGQVGGRSVTPGVRAHVVRQAVAHFPDDERTAALLAHAAGSGDPSVAFLALAAQGGPPGDEG